MTLIDRDKLLKFKQNVYDYKSHHLYAVPTGYIMQMPTVDAVATGRAEWDILVSNHVNDYWQADMACPLCGFIKMNIWSGFFPSIDAETARRVTMEYAKRCKKPNFCEKCGADMREGEKDG